MLSLIFTLLPAMYVTHIILEDGVGKVEYRMGRAGILLQRG